ncbi:MAG: flagellar biosynthetic protein FliQ [Phycisphaerales bacterium]
MQPAQLLDVVSQALMLVILVIGPVALLAGIGSFAIAVIQGATGMQEPAASNLVRLVLVYAAVAAGGAWALREIATMGVKLLEQLPAIQSGA